MTGYRTLPVPVVKYKRSKLYHHRQSAARAARAIQNTASAIRVGLNYHVTASHVEGGHLDSHKVQLGPDLRRAGMNGLTV